MPLSVALDVEGGRFWVAVPIEGAGDGWFWAPEALRSANGWFRAPDSRRPVFALSEKEGVGAGVGCPPFTGRNLGSGPISVRFLDFPGGDYANGRESC